MAKYYKWVNPTYRSRPFAVRNARWRQMQWVCSEENWGNQKNIMRSIYEMKRQLDRTNLKYDFLQKEIRNYSKDIEDNWNVGRFRKWQNILRENIEQGSGYLAKAASLKPTDWQVYHFEKGKVSVVAWICRLFLLFLLFLHRSAVSLHWPIAFL